MQLHFDHPNPPFFVDDKLNFPAIPNQYLKWVSGRSRNTLKQYAYSLLVWLNWCEKDGTDWASCDAEDVLRYKAQLTGTNRTLNALLARVRDFYAFAEHHGIANPTTRLIHPHNLLKVRVGGSRKQIQLISLRNLWKFIRGFSNPRDALFAELIFMTGMRRAEVLDLPTSILRLPTTNGRVVFKLKGKGGVVRTMQISEKMRDRLVEFVGETRSHWIFSHRGGPLHPDTVEKAFAKNRQQTGVDVHPHLLRHMYASYRLASLAKALSASCKGANSSLKIVQSELGHANIATTSQYLHVTDAQLASDSLDEWQRENARLGGGK